MTKTEYLIVCLIEELSEMQQELSKCLRFTINDKHPSKQETNLEGVCREWSDVLAILEQLDDQGIVIESDDRQIDAKHAKLEKFMRYSEELGVLED